MTYLLYQLYLLLPILFPVYHIVVARPCLKPFQHGFVVSHYSVEFLFPNGLVQTCINIALPCQLRPLLPAVEEVPGIPSNIFEFNVVVVSIIFIPILISFIIYQIVSCFEFILVLRHDVLHVGWVSELLVLLVPIRVCVLYLPKALY